MLVSGQPAKAETVAATTDATEDDLFKSTESRAHEDKNALAWDDMQDMVDGILRSMGYETRVSEAGPDRGRDIVAFRTASAWRPRALWSR